MVPSDPYPGSGQLGRPQVQGMRAGRRGGQAEYKGGQTPPCTRPQALA